jgi:hypothetical protein
MVAAEVRGGAPAGGRQQAAAAVPDAAEIRRTSGAFPRVG